MNADNLQGAFVARSGSAFNPLVPKPDIMEPTLERLADTIIAVDG